jgi:predicted transcriptional regulator
VSAARADGRAFTQLTRKGAELTLARVRRQLRTLDEDVARLYHGGAAELLGYGTGAAGWKALCADLFADVEMLRPTPAARLERVAELRRQEMSQRAIADTLGCSPAQVNADVRELERRGVELPSNVVSLDGARRKAQGLRTAADEQLEATAATQLPLDLEHLGLSQLMRDALEHVAGQLDAGLTCAELELETGWGHGRASSLLYRLERRGLIHRPGAFRGPHSVYAARLELLQAVAG